ncbi:MAG: 5-formyltetrahydrofolate cyclo-ligase [Clostridiales bacterium]|nr:5-formyltetrahydrofolate cyclo-ligase [Clostridiales bacterium]
MPINYSGDIREHKTLLRTQFKSIRAAYSPEKKEKLDIKITNRLMNIWKFREADLIYCYVSFGIEVDTRSIIDISLEKGKRLAVPRCVDGKRELEFYTIKSISELKPGAFGVLEPESRAENKITDLNSGLCIVPALSFDSKGFRLGFGKGYYDRFLSEFEGDSVGLCYSDCVVDKLPHGKYDKNVDILVTEKNLYSINNR